MRILSAWSLVAIIGRPLLYVIVIILLLPYFSISFIVFTAEPLEETYAVEAVQDVPKPPVGRIIRVASDGGGDLGSLAEAVMAASPGDRILVLPGVYRESVVVENKPWISIEGLDKNRVVLDGGLRLGNGIYVLQSSHVKVANLTVKDYLGNGVLYVSSDYYEVRDVVSLNNRVYGLYALESREGIFSGVVAAGSGDAGLYIGEVFDCECVIENSSSYNNVFGYSGTRSNGVTIRDSRFYNNSIGIAPNTLLPDIPRLLTGKWDWPLWASNHVIENNIVEDNNNRLVEPTGFAVENGIPIGTGIALIGTFGSTVRNNVVTGHEKWGVAEWYFLVPPTSNTYSANEFENNGADYWRDGWGFGSCSEAEQARGDVPPTCNLPPVLRFTIPNPIKHIELFLQTEIPGSSSGFMVASVAVAGLIAAGQTAVKLPSVANRRTRLASGAIDLLLVGDVYILLSVPLSGRTDIAGIVEATVSTTFLLLPFTYFLAVTIWVVYGFLSESITGRTCGKKLLGLKVSRLSRKPNVSRILIRNLLRYVDALGFGAVGFVFLLVLKRTVSDIIAGVDVERE